MGTSEFSKPPKWGERLIDWLCKPELVEVISGDLNEDFNDYCEKHGIRRARLYYWINLLRFLRPFAIRKFKYQNNTFMLKNYLKTSGRSIARNKLFSAINTIGLAISMTAGLIMISFIHEISSYDKFHRHADRTYRIISQETYKGNGPYGVAAAPLLAAERMEAEIPGIESFVTMNRRFRGNARKADKMISLKGLWASGQFFEVFPDFQLISGNPKTALTSPNSMVLTDQAALKIFEKTDVVGEVVEMDNGTAFTVTAVVEAPPFNSHFNFEALGSMITYTNTQKKPLRWTSMGNDYIYLRLQEGVEPTKINAEFSRIAREENTKSEHLKIDVELQPLLSIIPGPVLSNNIGKSMDTSILWAMLALTIIVIVSAAFNYTNLSLARSMRRMKEVGVRKVMGATKRQVFAQFLVEAVLISLLSLLFASCFFLLLKDDFLGLDPSLQIMVQLAPAPILILYFTFFSIIVGLMAGVLPSIALSRLQAISAMQSQNKIQLLKSVNLRKVLNIIQFTFSMVFIISATIAFRQYRYALTFDLGFDTANVININLQGNDADKVANALRALPEVENVSKNFSVAGIGGADGTKVKYDDPLDSARISYNFIDEQYIPLMNHRLLAGSNFEKADNQKVEQWIIVNEQVLKRFNIGTPQEAIGKTLLLENAKKLTIRGVVEDFVYSDISYNISNFAFRYNPHQYTILNVKLSASAQPSVMTKIGETWDEVSEGQPFEAYFHDSLIEQNYAQYEAIYSIVGLLAFLSITIAVLGLLGMAVYTTESRAKEISIRKTLGASSRSLVQLLSRSFCGFSLFQQ